MAADAIPAPGSWELVLPSDLDLVVRRLCSADSSAQQLLDEIMRLSSRLLNPRVYRNGHQLLVTGDPDPDATIEISLPSDWTSSGASAAGGTGAHKHRRTR